MTSLDALPNTCSHPSMGLVVKHLTSGETREVEGSGDLIHRDQWKIIATTPCPPDVVFRRHGTGLPPQPRDTQRDTRRRFG